MAGPGEEGVLATEDIQEGESPGIGIWKEAGWVTGHVAF